MSKTRTRKKPVRAAQQPKPVRDWAAILSEMVLLALVLVVPVIINRNSRNFLDIKDATLGIGVAAGLSLWLIVGLIQGRLSWAASRLNVAVIAFLLWAAVSVVYAGRFWFVAISEFGRLAANAGIFLLALVSLRTVTQVRRVIAAACIAAVPVCVYAFMQATGRDFIEWGKAVIRVHSTIGNSTYLGGYCMLIIPFAAVLLWPRRVAEARRAWIVPVLVATVIVMLAITLFLSFTLAAMIGLGLGAVLASLLLLLREGRRGIAKAGAVLLLAVGIAAPIGYVVYHRMPKSQQQRVQKVVHLQDPHAAERQLHWRAAYQLFRERPVLGWGYGAYRVYSLNIMAGEWYRQRVARTEGMLAPGYAHNEPLQVLADTGVIGGVLFAIVLLLTYVAAIRVSLRHPDPFWRRVGLATIITTTGFLFQNMVGVTFHQTGTVTFFWLWLALLVVAAATLPRTAEQGAELRLHEFRFRPRLVGAFLTTVAATCAVALVAWASVRPAIANVKVREAQNLAGRGYQEAAIIAAERTLELCPYSAIAYYTLAFSHGSLKHYGQALQANLKALELMPGNGSALYNLGVVYKEMGRWDEAVDAFRQSVAVMPAASNYIGLAEALLRQGNLEEAEAQARRAAELESELREDQGRQAELYLLLADIASRRKDHAKMLQYCRQAVKLQPSDSKAQSNLTRLLLALRRDQEAVEAARSWAEADPYSALPYGALGVAQYNTRDYRGANKSLARAVALDPSDLTSRYYLALTYGQLRDLESYRRELTRVAQAGRKSRWARDAQKRLGAIANLPASTGRR